VTTQPTTWTTRALLEWIAAAFDRAGVDSPRRAAEFLLAHVLGCERLRLYMDPDRPASEVERDRLRTLVRRALHGEPLQYLLGTWSFFGVELACDARALIPRPSTETLVEHILQHARRPDAAPIRRIADIGTGAGSIALALAMNLPNAHVIATDISADALELARENVDRHGLAGRVELRRGDLLEPLAGQTFDVIASNPPYIPDDEWQRVPAIVKDHEPATALRGGADGLDVVRRVLTEGPALLQPGGWLVVEVAARTARDAAQLAGVQTGMTDAAVLQDSDGLDRVVAVRREGAAPRAQASDLESAEWI